MQYLTVEEGRALTGLRLVATKGMPGPWGEAAKAILRVKGIPYALLAHEMGQDNSALRDWTGQDSAPVAIYQNERPRTGWAELLLLAERLAPTPALIPEDEADRALMFGIGHAICGEDGLGWNRRLMILGYSIEAAAAAADASAPASGPPPFMVRMMHLYAHPGWSSAVAEARVIKILNMLSARLEDQQGRGSEYLVGDKLTAADIYWAAFSLMFNPPAPDVCPMADFSRGAYGKASPELSAAYNPILFTHRDHILQSAFALPMQF